VGRADLHIHTDYGDGTASVAEVLAHVEARTELDVIAVTEHDDLSAALDGREQHARGSFRFQLIVGEEVTTLEGHVLALFIEQPVAALKPIAPTLEAIHRQGGLAVIPHPLSWLTRSVGRRTLDRLLAEQADGVYFDAIDTAGCGPAGRATRDRARKLNRERYHLAEVGGSDAHFLESIGTGYTRFDGASASDLRAAIETGTTSSGATSHPGWRQIGIRRVAYQQWRGITATPRVMGWRPTIASFFKRVRA
jgi:predicted metal-dependent phosphoesterase TrpH